MKNMNLIFATGAVLASSMIVAGTARAEELPQTKKLQQSSVTQGFKQTEAPIMHRTGSADQKAVSAGLIQQLHLGSAYQSASNGGKLRLTGTEWSLEISGDGTAAEFRDSAAEERAHSLAKPVLQKMPAAELEARGRAFIASTLASEIVIGPDEELVPVRTDYRIEGGQDLYSGEVSEAVVANRIVFSRTLHGVPVVGNGSKVILTFTNEGALESFRYDWPRYSADTARSLAGIGEILDRVQKVVGARSGVAAATAAVAVPTGQGEAYPVTLTPNTQLQKLECGYYDPGAFAVHSQASVQPGCVYHAVSQDVNGMRQGYAGAVPAGMQFDVDAAWIETQLLGRK